MSDYSFSTFWHGPAMTAMEKACLSSFAARGHKVYVYSYQDLSGLPEGVERRDARDVVEEKYLNAYIVKGRSSIAHFSDLFRLALMQHDRTFWIDADMVLLPRTFDWDLSNRLMAKEEDAKICAGILYIPQTDPALSTLVENCKARTGEIQYSATNIDLYFGTLGRDNVLNAAPTPDVFYPVHFDEFWKVFLPEYRDECMALSRNAYTLHLWNNLVEQAGIWKEFAPPKGSYLDYVFEQAGVLHHFKDTYPEKVMRNIITNWVARNGENIGFVRLSGLIVGSIKNTLRRRIKKDFNDRLLEKQKPLSYLARTKSAIV